MFTFIYCFICLIIMVLKFCKVFMKHCYLDLDAFNYVGLSDVIHNALAGLIVASIYFIIFASVYFITDYFI